MNLTARQKADLQVMALEGVKNANIALALGLETNDVHAARSRLGCTVEKAADTVTEPCGCCGAPVDEDHLYRLPNGAETYFCERCKLNVDYVNSFEDEDETEDEFQEYDEEYEEPEDEDEL